MKKVNLAIISPSQNAYSETFIQAHKNLIDANISYYYGASIPTHLEGKGVINPILKKGINKLIGKQKNDADWDAKKALKNSFKKEKIAVVLAEYGTVGARILPVCKELNLPLIVHFHGYDASVYDVLEKYKNYKNVFEYATKIIAVSKAMEAQLLSIGCPKEKLVLNTYGPNNEFHKLTPTMEDELFVGIGRFTDKKAPYYTILAFKEVVKEFPNAKLMIGGNGVLMNTCENLIKLYGLEKNIDLLGVITPETYRNYLLKARAFVQHSITASNGDMEGTPLAVLEASSAGIPVISTIHAGIPDVIIDGKTGLLVNEHDVTGMTKKMLMLLTNKKLAIEMGHAGKKNISEHFSMQKHINTLNELINNID
jgi:glycosyltransferase involved in cell wall biosynthesis